MGDPNFERSVILMLQHGSEGAMGLVLNDPTELAVRDAVEQVAEVECQTDAVLYRGGPCEGPLMALHSDPIHAQEQVLDGVYFATEREYIEPALSGQAGPARFFAGYSGWGEGQLESELAQRAWVVMEADAATVFDPEGKAFGSGESKLWRALIRVKHHSELLKGVNPKALPRDPSLN